jgi:hypothetical protein
LSQVFLNIQAAHHILVANSLQKARVNPILMKLSPFGISVVSIEPGFFKIDFSDAIVVARGRGSQTRHILER